jgi:hypothetical protein
VAVIGSELGQLVELVLPTSGMWLSCKFHLSNID